MLENFLQGFTETSDFEGKTSLAQGGRHKEISLNRQKNSTASSSNLVDIKKITTS